MLINIRTNTFIESNTVKNKEEKIYLEQLDIKNNVLYIECQHYGKMDVLIKTSEKISLILISSIFDKRFREHFISILTEMFPTIQKIKIKHFNPIKPFFINLGKVIVEIYSFLNVNDISMKDFLLNSRYTIVVKGVFNKKIEVIDLTKL